MACSNQDKKIDAHEARRLSLAESNPYPAAEPRPAGHKGEAATLYSDTEPGLLPVCHETYQMRPAASAHSWCNRTQRILLSNIKGGIDRDGDTDIVDVIHISRSGVSFRSTLEYSEGTPVSIATHYVRGGQNIYQSGVVVSVRRKPCDDLFGEYDIQFAPIGAGCEGPAQALYLRGW